MFSGTAIREALKVVSETRLQRTIFAEYPRLRRYIVKLEGEKATQTVETLSKLWGLERSDAMAIAEELAEMGVFERVVKQVPEFKVPFLYRSALKLVQGKANG